MTIDSDLFSYTSKLAKKLHHVIYKPENTFIPVTTNSISIESGELSMFQDDMEYMLDELSHSKHTIHMTTITDNLLEILVMISSNRLFFDSFASSKYIERILFILSENLSSNCDNGHILTLFSLFIHTCTALGLNMKRQIIGFPSFHILSSMFIKSESTLISLDILTGRKFDLAKENQSFCSILKAFSYHSTLLDCIYIFSSCKHRNFALPTHHQLLYIISNVNLNIHCDKLIHILAFIHELDDQLLIKILTSSNFLCILYNWQLSDKVKIQLVTLMLNMSNDPLVGQLVTKTMMNSLWDGLYHSYKQEMNEDLVIVHIALLCNLYEKHSNIMEGIYLVGDQRITHSRYLVETFKNCSSSLMGTILSSYLSLLIAHVILGWNTIKTDDYNLLVSLLSKVRYGINDMILLHRQSDGAQFSDVLDRLKHI